MREMRLVLAFTILILLTFTVHAETATSQFPLLWSADINGESIGVRGVDLNTDGKGEVIVGSVFQSFFGKDGLIRAFGSDGSTLWSYRAGLLDDSYTTPSGKTAVASFGQAVLLGTDGTSIIRRNMRLGPALYVTQSIYSADFDGDGLEDLVGGINLGLKGDFLYLWSNSGFQYMKISYKSTEFPHTFAAADLSGDKKNELIVGIIKFSPNSIGKTYDEAASKAAYVEALNMDGSSRWTFDTDGGVTALGVEDVNSDGNPEIVVGTPERIYVLDKEGKLLWKINVEGTVNEIGFGDINGDGGKDVFVAAGKLYVFDSKGDTVWTHASGQAYSMKVVDLDGDGKSEVLVGTTGVRYLESDGSLVWKSDSFRKVNGMDAFDLDGDGFMEIIAGCSDSNVRVFSASSYLMKQKADAYYQKALEYSGDRKYESCVQFISNASGLYEKLSDASGSSRAETLKEKCTNQLTASGYMNKSMLYFSQGDYINSTIYVDRALDLYRMMGDTKSVNEAVSLKDKIRVTPLSGEYLNYSKYYFEAGLYDNASFYAAKAREAYSYMGDSDGVAAAEEVSNNVSRAQAYALIQTALSKSESGDLNASIYLQEANVTFIRLNDTDGLAAVANASLVVSSRMADAERMSSIRGAIDGVINTLTENIMVVIAFVVVGIIVLLILVAVALSLYINKGDTPNKEGGSGGSYLDDFGKRKKGGGALSHLGSSLGKGQDGIPLF